MKLGMRKATTKASMAGLAPNTTAYTWSRIRPETREMNVITLKMLADRSKPLAMGHTPPRNGSPTPLDTGPLDIGPVDASY
ncbi:hypothetical protein GCM10028795_15030 [Lysobacter olei]